MAKKKAVMVRAVPKLSKKKSNKKKVNNSDKLTEQMHAISLASSVAKTQNNTAKARNISLPKCTIKYALAISDPFHPAARGACVPMGSASTMKTHAFLRFDVTIGTGGLAIVFLTPSLSNDLPSIFHTTSAYDGTTFDPIATGAVYGSGGTASTLTTGWTRLNHNGPFTAGQLIGGEIAGSTSSPVQGRMVSAGMRAQYTGTTLNESGLYYCYHDPAHTSLSGATVAVMGSFGDADITGVSRHPCHVTAHAVTEAEVDWSSSGVAIGNNTTELATLYPYANGMFRYNQTFEATSGSVQAGFGSGSIGTFVVPVGVPIAAIYITGVNGQSVHLETVFHMEFQGVGAASMLTPTMADPQGAALVRTAALALPQAKLDNPKADLWGLMVAAMKQGATAAIPFVVPAVKAGLTALLT